MIQDKTNSADKCLSMVLTLVHDAGNLLWRGSHLVYQQYLLLAHHHLLVSCVFYLSFLFVHLHFRDAHRLFSLNHTVRSIDKRILSFTFLGAICEGCQLSIENLLHLYHLQSHLDLLYPSFADLEGNGQVQLIVHLQTFVNHYLDGCNDDQPRRSLEKKIQSQGCKLGNIVYARLFVYHIIG